MLSPTFLTLSLLAFFAVNVNASPPPLQLDRRATPVSSATLNDIVTFANFAKASYCPMKKIQSWQCGKACGAIPGFKPTLAGGDNSAVQNYIVGFWEKGNTVMVVHEGTDPLQLRADLTNLNILKGPLDSKLFPGAPSDIRVHMGFRDQHAIAAELIFAEVQKLLASSGAKTVTVTGQSLGGALSLLTGLSMRLRLDASIKVNVRAFGTPRTGDANFVSFFDSKMSENMDVQRILNRLDPTPILPPKALGYLHPQGEIHLISDGNAVKCNGDDNDVDPQCLAKTLSSNILKGNALDHLGPYEGVWIGSAFCN